MSAWSPALCSLCSSSISFLPSRFTSSSSPQSRWSCWAPSSAPSSRPCWPSSWAAPDGWSTSGSGPWRRRSACLSCRTRAATTTASASARRSASRSGVLGGAVSGCKRWRGKMEHWLGRWMVNGFVAWRLKQERLRQNVFNRSKLLSLFKAQNVKYLVQQQTNWWPHHLTN